MPGSAENPTRSHILPWVSVLCSALLSAAGMIVIYAFFLQQKPISHNGVISFLLAGLVLTGILFFLIHKFILPYQNRLPRSLLGSILFTSLLGGFFLLTFSAWGIPGLRLFPNHLRISVDGQKNPASQAMRVELLGFQSGKDFISYQTFQKHGNWHQNGTVLSTEQPGVLFWQGRVPDTVLIFRTSPQSGMVRVSWDGRDNTYDLYNKEDGQMLVHDEHPVPTWSRWLVAGLAAVCLSFIIFLILIFVAEVFKPEPPADPLQVKHPLFQDRTDRIAVLISLAGIIFFLLVTYRFGLWIASDSGSYISAARHLVAGEGYISLDSDSYVWWPPLYPAVLAALELLPGGIFTWALFFNAFLYGACIYLTWIIFKLLSPPGYRLPVVGLLLVLFSRALLSSFIYILSEPLFITLTLVFLSSLIFYIKDRHLPAALITILSASLIPLVRYIGVIVILTGSIAILLFLKKDFKKRVFHAFIFGLATSLPILLWLGRNYLLEHSLTGIRTSSYTPLFENVQRTLATLWDWFIPRPGGFWSWAGMAILITLLILVYRFRPKGVRSIKFRQLWTIPVFTLLIFIVFYVGGLIYTLSSVNNAPIGDRLLSPIFIPLLAILLYFFEYLRTGFTQFSSKLSLTFSLMLHTILLIPPLSLTSTTSRNLARTTNAAISIYSPMASNDVIKTLKQTPLPAGVMIYSNCPRCLYLYAGIHPAVEFNDTPKYRNLPHDSAPFIIVWFNDIPPSGFPGDQQYPLPDLDAILGRKGMTKSLYESKAGKILQIQP